MALLDCAINKKCCTVDGGRCICPLFSSPPRGDLPSKAKKMLIPEGQPGGAWAQVELTDALFRSNIKCLLQNIQNCWQRFSKFQTRVSLLHFLKETLPAILNISKKTTLKIRANILLNRL